jgi:hypothetical protein
MSLNIPQDAEYPGYLLVYSLLPAGSSIDKLGNKYTITYPNGVQEDLVEYVQATPGLGLRIIRANNVISKYLLLTWMLIIYFLLVVEQY